MEVQSGRTAAIASTILVVLAIIVVLFIFLISSYTRKQVNTCTTHKENHKNGKNIVVVGDGACGKTCLLTVFDTGIFPEKYTPTCMNTFDKSIEVGGETVKLKLWDTTGHEGNDKLRKSTYNSADAFLVCFAIDNQDSFANVAQKWGPELDEISSQAPRILVGNKMDIRNNKEWTAMNGEMVNTRTADDVKDGIKMVEYVECSAKTSEGVENVFNVAAREAVKFNKLKLKKKSMCF